MLLFLYFSATHVLRSLNYNAVEKLYMLFIYIINRILSVSVRIQK